MGNFTDLDAYLFGQGTHYDIYNKLGAHKAKQGWQTGFYFDVWAPHATAVSVVGDFNNWDETANFMQRIEPESIGVFETFIPDAKEGQMYKYLIYTSDGTKLYKADPYATYAEERPGTASILFDNTKFKWSDSTYNQYITILTGYMQIQQATFSELLNEAINDENQNIKLQQRKIKQRLMQYILHYQQQGRTNSTIRLYISRICKVYKYYDIEIPTLPPLTKEIPESYEDIPTHEHIKCAIENSKIKNKAIISLIASSGLSRIEVSKLTIQDFIDATSQYHNENNIFKVIEALKKKDNIIATWYFTRQKTKIKGYTFSSPESTSFIIAYLQQILRRKLLTNNDKLFGINKEEITASIRRLNNKCGFGLTRKHSFLHPHVLRSFFATTLTNEGCDFLTVEFLLGHRIKDVTASYYKANPEKLKKKYEKYVKYLCFTIELKEVKINDNELLELEELRDYKKSMDKRLRNLEELLKVM